MATATEARNRIGTYEVMFLVSQAQAAMLGGLLQHINDILARSGGEVLAMKKWDERRLAYEIDKQKRGVFILSYFTCPTDMISKLERDAQISSRILRLLVIKADHLTEEEILANDERQALADEARFRAERAESAEDEGSSRVRLGAPEQQQQQPEAQTDGDEGGESDADQED